MRRHGGGHADGRARARGARTRSGGAPFFLTYGDGVADVDLAGAARRARAAGALATMTVVRPELPFGVAVLDAGDRVTGFREKPVAEQWVNGGFLVLEPEVLGLPGARLRARARAARAARRRRAGCRPSGTTGFWACMDTHKDALALNALWDAGRAPWVAK